MPVAFIGDSYTVGVCVPSDSAIPGRLRSRYPLLNLGVTGAGPLQQLAVLREYGALARPSIVAWIFYEGNDFRDATAETYQPWLARYLDAGHTQHLARDHAALDVAYGAWIDSLMSAPQARQRHSPIPDAIESALRIATLRLVLGVHVDMPGAGADPGILVDVLLRANADAAAWGGSLLVIRMPARERYRALIGDPYPESAVLMARLRSERIATLDLHDALAADGDPTRWWASTWGHLTPAGYAVAANAIARAIDALGDARDGLDPPRPVP